MSENHHKCPASTISPWFRLGVLEMNGGRDSETKHTFGAGSNDSMTVTSLVFLAKLEEPAWQTISFWWLTYPSEKYEFVKWDKACSQ